MYTKIIPKTESAVSINSPVLSLPTKIEIGAFESLLGIVILLVGIGIAWGSLRTLVKNIKETLDKEIKPPLKKLNDRFMVVEDRVETMWKQRAKKTYPISQLGRKAQNIP
mgnify:CR=1 FL=1